MACVAAFVRAAAVKGLTALPKTRQRRPELFRDTPYCREHGDNASVQKLPGGTLKNWP